MNETTSQQSILNKSSKDKFLLVMNLPPVLKSINIHGRGNSTVDLDKLQFSIEGSIIPDISIPGITIPFSGQSLKVTSYSREPYLKNNVKFTIDNRFTNWWVLWKWLNVLNDYKKGGYNQSNLPSANNLPFENLHDYQADITIYGHDEFNVKTIQAVYYKAFITSLGGINYDYQDPAQITSFFEFEYSQLHIDLL